MKSVQEIVRDAETNYLNAQTKMGKYVSWSMHDTIETIDAYLNSKHISGPKDSLQRDKPFFNIVTAAANIWWRATDIDRKDIRIIPTENSQVGIAFIATVMLQNWMKEARFGVFLNEWGRSLARYGSTVAKFVEQDGKLIPLVIPWNRLIVDPVDFDALPRIEKFYRTADQLRANANYDQDQVTALLNAVANRKTLDNQDQDTQSNFIELYEVHGEMESSLLDAEPKPEEDQTEATYRQQMHVVSFVKNDKDQYDDFTLYKGAEAKDPYMLTHLIKEDGRTLSIGAVEYLFDAQWMANHTMKNWKDQLDLASRLIFQTADQKFVGRNVLTSLETGDIFVHGANMPLEPVQNVGHDTGSMESFHQMWNQMAQEITSTPDAMRGVHSSGVAAYRQAALLTQAASTFFDIMTENKGLALEDMLRQHILPYLEKQLDHNDQIVAMLDDAGIAEIDAQYVPREAVRQHNASVKKALLSGGVPSPYQPDVAQAQIRQQMSQLGNRRFFKPSDIDNKTWKEAFKDFEMHGIVEITNEDTDQQAVLTTLSSVLQTIASNPAILQDPNAKMLFGRILTQTGAVSPLELSAPAPQPAPAAPGAVPPQVPSTALPPHVIPQRQTAAPLVGG